MTELANSRNLKDRFGRHEDASSRRLERRIGAKILKMFGLIVAPVQDRFGGSSKGQNLSHNGTKPIYGESAMELPTWVDDSVGLWPVRDRGGPMSAYEGPANSALLGVLARIELNEASGEKDLSKGLPKSPKNPLEPPPADPELD